MREFIHYGHKRYDEQKFVEVMTDRDGFEKPLMGGLWCCENIPEKQDAWIDWCRSEKFMLKKYKLTNYFTFHVSDNANICKISSRHDIIPLQSYINDIHGKMLTLIGQINNPDTWWLSPVYFDFEKMRDDGIDGLELDLSKDPGLRYAFYSWDISSVLIMNKEIIIPAKESIVV